MLWEALELVGRSPSLLVGGAMNEVGKQKSWKWRWRLFVYWWFHGFKDFWWIFTPQKLMVSTIFCEISPLQGGNDLIWLPFFFEFGWLKSSKWISQAEISRVAFAKIRFDKRDCTHCYKLLASEDTGWTGQEKFGVWRQASCQGPF